MILSNKLQSFFEKYDYNYSYEFCRTIFSVKYSKTYSDCGLYIWFGKGHDDFHSNLYIDKDSPMCLVKTDDFYIADQKIAGYNIYIFLDYTEDEIIHKFTRYQNLKAFL